MVYCISKHKLAYSFFIFIVFSIIFVTTTTDQENEQQETILKDFIICRHCGSDISLSNFLLRKTSPSALASANLTLFNTEVLVQHLKNPLGVEFKVILVKQATCHKIENWKDTYTWFPGYSWKICICPKCSIHLGWMYEPTETATSAQQFPSENGFYVLALNNIISETFINSLLMTDWI